MYKEDLALNNLQGLICHKTKPLLNNKALLEAAGRMSKPGHHWAFLLKVCYPSQFRPFHSTRSSPLNPEDIRLSPPIVMWPNFFPALILHRYESLDCYPCVLLHRDGAIVGLSIRRLQCCSQDTRLLIEKLRLGVLLGPVYVEKVSARPSGTHYICKPTIGPVL